MGCVRSRQLAVLTTINEAVKKRTISSDCRNVSEGYKGNSGIGRFSFAFVLFLESIFLVGGF